jgi:Protein of unknown function (DUF2911)
MWIRWAQIVLLLVSSAGVLAQAPAPRGTATASPKGKQITIEYGRPALKGRTVNDLTAQLPPDRMWRAGADRVTTLTTEADILIGGKKVPAGKYTLYVHIPQSGDWSLAINTDPGIELIKLWPAAPPEAAKLTFPRLDGYQKNIADKEIARVPMKSGTIATPVELFTITLDPGGVLTMMWGDRSWSVDVRPAS